MSRIERLMSRIERLRYVGLYGPTTGDRIRLADTDIFIEVSDDLCGGPGRAGDEAVFGVGKVLRESMGQGRATRAHGAPDTVITGAVVLDWWGVVKADVGVRDGRIVALGKAGNPDTMDGVHPDLVVGPSTEVIAGNGKILTAGGVDCHVHFICPQIIPEALGSGLTTLIGGGTEPAEGSKATTATPGAWHLARMLEALDGQPMNFVLLGKGSTVSEEGMWEQLCAGACGFKIHEDWGATPAAIDACLRVADASGTQVALHTDTLNELGYVADTLAAIAGRGVHTYHTERAGGGYAPDIITVASHPNILPSSTNPTRPHTVNTIDEHLDMLMVCHHLNPAIPEDLAFAESRIRLHHRGGGSAARHRGDFDDRQRLPSHGQRRRSGHPDVADRRCHEAQARPARRRRPRRQQSRPSLCRQIHDLPGDRARPRRRDRQRRTGQARRPRAVGHRVLRRATASGPQGRHDRLGADEGRERLDPPRSPCCRGRCSGLPRPLRCTSSRRRRPSPPSRTRSTSDGGWSWRRTCALCARSTSSSTRRGRTSRSTRTRSPCGWTAASLAAHLAAGRCDVGEAENAADARTPPRGARSAEREQVRGLARLARTSWPDFAEALPPRPHLTTVLGALGRHLGLGPGDVAAVFVYTAMSAAATAAQRLLALDPQRVAAATLRLSSLCDEIAAQAAGGVVELSDPLGDVLAERHELRDQALFKS